MQNNPSSLQLPADLLYKLEILALQRNLSKNQFLAQLLAPISVFWPPAIGELGELKPKTPVG